MQCTSHRLLAQAVCAGMGCLRKLPNSLPEATLLYLRSCLRRAIIILANGADSYTLRGHSRRDRPQCQSVAHPSRNLVSLFTPIKVIDRAAQYQFSQGQPGYDECSKSPKVMEFDAVSGAVSKYLRGAGYRQQLGSQAGIGCSASGF